MTSFHFLILALAAYRITRLITTDSVSTRPLAHVIALFPYKVQEFLIRGAACDWCVGVWVSAGLGVWAFWSWVTFAPIGFILAAATTVGLIAEKI